MAIFLAYYLYSIYVESSHNKKNAMDLDRRKKQQAIPDHLEQVLNKLQMTTLLQLQAIGWRLLFVRRPENEPVMPVLCDPSNGFTAIIEENGSSNAEHGLVFRPY